MRWTLLLALLLTPLPSRAEDRGLIGHWRFSGDANDASGRGNHGRAFAVDLTAPGPDGRPDGAARFDGKSSYVEVPASPALDLGKGDFTLAVWAHTEESLDDVLGDLVSKYDPAARRGLNWCIKSGAGMTNSQANDRNVHFGIDAGTEPVWSDRGRPGNAVYVMAMAVHDGKLFVGTCEAGPGEAGHVYRYDGGSRWVDCGSPDRCNAVTSLAAFGGKLYAGTGRYRLAGSALARIDEREPGRQGRPLRRRRRLGRLRPVARRRRPWAGWSSSAANSTPRRCTSRPASSATEGATRGSAAPCPPTAAGSSPSASSTDTSTRGRTTPAPSARFDGKGWEAFPALESIRPDLLVRGPRGASSSSGPGRTGRSSGSTAASAGSRPAGWGRRRRSWGWPSTTASSTPARSRSRRSIASTTARAGPGPAGST